jgi:hypothetical protein
MSQVHLVAVVGGGDTGLLTHLVKHYRGLGVESFYLIRHAESRQESGYAEIQDRAKAEGVELFRTHLGPWSDDLHGQLMTEAMDQHPDDWYLPVDLDEFHVYDRPMPDLIELCERDGFTHVCGCFIDRVGPDGTLPAITESPLWESFPLGGAVTTRLIGAPSLKVCLLKGRVGVGGGHHGIPGDTGVPRRLAYVQVHHFKWTASLVERMRRRVERYESGTWRLVYPSVLDEARRVLARLDSNGGRVDTGDARLLLRPCGSSYDECPQWNDIVRDAQRWQSIMKLA